MKDWEIKTNTYNGLTDKSVLTFTPFPVVSIYIPYSTKNIRLCLAWLCFAIEIWIQHKTRGLKIKTKYEL